MTSKFERMHVVTYKETTVSYNFRENEGFLCLNNRENTLKSFFG